MLGPRYRRALAAFDRFQQRRKITAVPVAVTREFSDDRAGNLAALVAFYSFFSLFPLLLALVTILGFVLRDDPERHRQLVDSALIRIPVVGSDLRTNLTALEGSPITLIIGLGGALWAGMGAGLAMQTAMGSVWSVAGRRRGFVRARLRALGALAGILLAVVGSAIVTGLVLSRLDRTGGVLGLVGWLAGLAVASVVGVGVFLLSFEVLTERSEPPADGDGDGAGGERALATGPGPTSWRDHLPGSIVAGVGWTLLQAGGGVYLSQVVSRASATYGTFAVVLGLLTWLFVLARLTLFAAELNVVLAEGRWPRSVLAAPDATKPPPRG